MTARDATATIKVLDSKGNEQSGDIIVLNDFADDQDPMTVDDCDIAELFFDVNGKVHRRSKLEPVNCHIALVPGSGAERDLNRFVIKNLSVFGEYSWVNIHVQYPSIEEEVVFYKGILTGASMGYAATSQGRIRTKNFSFQFATCNRPPA